MQRIDTEFTSVLTAARVSPVSLFTGFKLIKKPGVWVTGVVTLQGVQPVRRCLWTVYRQLKQFKGAVNCGFGRETQGVINPLPFFWGRIAAKLKI